MDQPDIEPAFLRLLETIDALLPSASEFPELASSWCDSSLADISTAETELHPQPLDECRIAQAANCLWLLELDRRRMTAESSAATCGSFPDHQIEKKTNGVVAASTPLENHKRGTEPDSTYEPEITGGSQIGRFRIIRPLGKGGFGIVFLAEDPLLQRCVALKILRPERIVSADVQRRFVRESQLAAQLTHPNLVPVFEVGQKGLLTYHVTEYCSGGNLAELLQKLQETQTTSRPVPLPESVAIELMIQIADGVHHAHQHGILHRDLKPANILLHPIRNAELDTVSTQYKAGSKSELFTTDRDVKTSDLDSGESIPAEGQLNVDRLNQLCSMFRPMVADFGLARVIGASAPPEESTRQGKDSEPAAPETTVAGTFSYMAPEQREGRTEDLCAATDVYALGLILAELLRGQRLPFITEKKNVSAAVQTPVCDAGLNKQTDFGPDLTTIISKCLRPTISERYGSARELADDLRAMTRGEPVTTRPWPWDEQLKKWAKRRPGLAAMIGCCLILVFALVSVGSWHLKQLSDFNRKLVSLSAERQRQTELAHLNSLQAARESDRASELAWLAEHGEYSSEMVRASELFRRGEFGPMNDLLKRFHRTKVTDPRGFEWHYLWHQGSTFRSMSGHADIPAAAEFSADRSRLYSIADDDTLRQWNMTTFQEEAVWSLGANSAVRNTHASFNRNATRAVIVRTIEARNVEEAIVWDVESGRAIMRREYPFDSLSFVAMSPDGHMAVLTGKLQNSGEEPQHSLLAELWLPDSNEVIPDAFDLSNLTVREPGLQYQAVRSVQFSPDGHHLVMSLALQGAPLFKYQLLRYSNLSLDEEWSNQSSIKAPHFSPVEYLGVPAHGIPNDLQVFSAGTHVAVLLEHPNRVDLWTLANGVSVKYLVNGTETPTSIAFDRHAPQLCTGIMSGTESATGIVEAPSLQATKAPVNDGLRIWGLNSQSSEFLSWPSKDNMSFLRMLPETYGQGWLVGDLRGSLYLWQPQNARPFESLSGHHPRECWGLSWATDGKSLFSVGDDHQLRSWDISTFSEKHSVIAGTTLVSCVAVSPKGQYVATGGYDELVRLFGVSDLELISQSAGHTQDIRTLAFSSDGNRLATAGRDRTIRLWNVPDLTPIKVLEGHTDTIRTLRWMANGNLVSSDSNGQILMWNSAGKVVAKRDEADGVHALEFAPAGVRFIPKLSLADHKTGSLVSTSLNEELLVIGTRHGTIRFLHLPTNRVLSEIRSPDTEVRCLTFSNDGKSLVTGNGDGSVRVFQVSTQREIGRFENEAAVYQVQFSPDGNQLCAALHNGRIRCWQIPE